MLWSQSLCCLILQHSMHSQSLSQSRHLRQIDLKLQSLMIDSLTQRTGNQGKQKNQNLHCIARKQNNY